MDREVTITNAAGEISQDRVTLEEPLQIVVDGHPIAVSMRTPGHDEELALGFLLTEGVIRHAAEVRRIDATLRENHVMVFLRDDVAVDLSRLTRHVFSASSCGICGKATIDAVSLSLPPIGDGFQVHHDALLEAPLLLMEQQSTFSRTGGLHAAGLFDAAGKLLVAREDVGRHNAVDKVLGHALTAGLDLTASFLLVSGRVSFEIMQKALAGGIPLVAAISAPSSLAIDFAVSSNQTLIAFLRPPRFQIYAGAERLVPS